MRKTIFSKIFFSFFVLTLMLSSLIIFFSFKTIKGYYINSLINYLKNINYSLEPQIKGMLLSGKVNEIDPFVKDLGKKLKIRITIIDKKGIVLGDSKKDPRTMENHIGRPEVQKAIKSVFGYSLRFSTTVEDKMLYVAKRIDENGSTIAFLRTSLFIKDINLLLGSLRLRIILLSTIIMFFSLFVAYFFSLNLSKPIKEIAELSKNISSGDFNIKIPVSQREDEIGILSRNFNDMIEKLKKMFTELIEEKEKLKKIVSSLDEPLALINKDGKIYVANKSFLKLTSQESIDNKFYWEILRDSKINSLIEKAKNEKHGFIFEVQISDKFYLLGITYIKSSDELILIFQDITEFKKLEQLKREFIVNVTHELKTPLTSIKGYIETLEDEVDGKAKRYVDILKRNTERLINLVNDLLTLSELDEKERKLNLVDYDLIKIVNNVVLIFKEKAEEKGLKLSISTPDELKIKCDPFKLEQLLINLIDNAIKYTEKGEVKVEINDLGSSIELRVKDTGIGIPEESIPRIFERFYVVDKSRSRSLGGTGLGLSIVKHIVLKHNGEIKVKSEKNKGTEFIITLSKNINQ